MIPITLVMLLLICIVLSVMMAAKNPARVAAGKKAWATRMKGGAKRPYTRAKGYRRKPIQRGLVGRFGAFMIGGVPPIAATVDVASAIAVQHKQGAGMMSLANMGFLRWVNNMTQGFAGVKAFDEYITMVKADGTTYKTLPGAGIPKGSFLITAGVGLFMMLEDFIASKLAGGRPVKIPFTNYNATGGS